jgi:hypothetical protein
VKEDARNHREDPAAGELDEGVLCFFFWLVWVMRSPALPRWYNCTKIGTFAYDRYGGTTFLFKSYFDTFLFFRLRKYMLTK